MQTFKKIMIWAFIIIIVYIISDFSRYYLIASTYKDIETQIQNSNDLKITVKESKATYVNGYAIINIENNSLKEINNKYILLDGYSELDNNLTSKYVEINNLLVGETREIKIMYNAQKVKKIIINESNAKPENYTITEEKIDGPTILVTAIILLYFFG